MTLVERVVDDDFPFVPSSLKGFIRQFTDVSHEDFARTLRCPPFEVMPDEKLIFLGNPELAEQEFLDLQNPVARVVHRPGLLQNALRVHAGQLHGYRRIRWLVANFNLPDFRRPPPALAENHVAFAPRNW